MFGKTGLNVLFLVWFNLSIVIFTANICVFEINRENIQLLSVTLSALLISSLLFILCFSLLFVGYWSPQMTLLHDQNVWCFSKCRNSSSCHKTLYKWWGLPSIFTADSFLQACSMSIQIVWLFVWLFCASHWWCSLSNLK